MDEPKEGATTLKKKAQEKLAAKANPVVASEPEAIAEASEPVAVVETPAEVVSEETPAVVETPEASTEAAAE